MIAKRRAAQLHAENPYAIRYTTGSRDRRIKNRITGLASSRLLRAGSNYYLCSIRMLYLYLVKGGMS